MVIYNEVAKGLNLEYKMSLTEQTEQVISPKYTVGQHVTWYLGPCVITHIQPIQNGEYYYQLKHIDYDLPCRVSEGSLNVVNVANDPAPMFTKEQPSIIVVDNFYKDPMLIRNIALTQEYYPNAKSYKGKRTATRLLLPNLKEEFERLLGVRIKNWLSYPVNGSFQITKYTDPLVWHSDLQDWAAAIYLTPDAPVNAGTSFWKDKKYGCRRPPLHDKEKDRFQDDTERTEIQKEIYSDYNLLHQDNWELVDKVGCVFNRLVIWDSQMIHSASSYENFVTNNDDKSRLVQLFFFDIYK